jgi:hypothetical protein
MARTIVRGLIGLVGLLAILLAARFWMDPAKIGAQLGLQGLQGLQGLGVLGSATLRADVGGFFGVAGALSLAAAIRNDARLLTAPLLLVSLALSARLLTVLLQGAPAPSVPPMAVEAALVLILALGRRLLPVRK